MALTGRSFPTGAGPVIFRGPLTGRLRIIYGYAVFRPNRNPEILVRLRDSCFEVLTLNHVGYSRCIFNFITIIYKIYVIMID
jgi:hypothetical protein